MLTLAAYLLMFHLTGSVNGLLMALPFLTDLMFIGIMSKWAR